MKYRSKPKFSEWSPPVEVVDWFLRRFIRDPDALTFARRLWHIIPADELSIDQRKKMNWNLKRLYTWLNFNIYRIDKNRWEIVPDHPDAQWAKGEIYIDEFKGIIYQSQ